MLLACTQTSTNIYVAGHRVAMIKGRKGVKQGDLFTGAGYNMGQHHLLLELFFDAKARGGGRSTSGPSWTTSPSKAEIKRARMATCTGGLGIPTLAIIMPGFDGSDERGEPAYFLSANVKKSHEQRHPDGEAAKREPIRAHQTRGARSQAATHPRGRHRSRKERRNAPASQVHISRRQVRASVAAHTTENS